MRKEREKEKRARESRKIAESGIERENAQRTRESGQCKKRARERGVSGES